MRTIVAGVLAYVAGFICYTVILKIVWAQSLEGDTYAVLLWGAIAFFLIAVPIYMLIIYVVMKFSTKYQHIYYPLSCMLVFFVPTAFITMLFGGTWNIFTSEALLFHAFFLAAGAVFGVTRSVWK